MVFYIFVLFLYLYFYFIVIILGFVSHTDLYVSNLQAAVRRRERSCKCPNQHPKGHDTCAQHSPLCWDRPLKRLTPWNCPKCANLLILAATDSIVSEYYRRVAACFFFVRWKNISKHWDPDTASNSFRRFPFMLDMLVSREVY